MRSSGWRVPSAEAERVRRELRERGILREDLGVAHDGDHVIFPVRAAPEAPADLPGSSVTVEFEPRPERGPRSYRDLLSLPPELSTLLPRAFDVVGEVVLIRLPDELLPRSEEIGRALLEFVPSARLVVRDEGVHGWQRTRTLVRLAGDGPARTIHRENGLALEVDLETAYFSPRLGREHALVAGAVRDGESVLDLCAGIGPFSLAIASLGRAREIVAVDANPAAIELLESNRHRLGFDRRIRAVCADLEEFLPSAGVADRVVFNLPREGIKYLTSVGKSVSPAGTLHYYEMTDRGRAAERPTE
ncbi:MAG: methyltransferase domain-containing protein, partial [Thermoplasmata archaeon]|nr:methyltransferase domain-containing protein [Thermoplasmata archaeon]